MAVQVQVWKLEPGIVILRLSGKLILTETERLHATYEGLLHDSQLRVIFDLAGINEIDNGGCLFCIRCFFAARQAGGELRFAAANTEVSGPFKRAMLDSLLPFDPTVAAACEYFQRRARIRVGRRHSRLAQ